MGEMYLFSCLQPSATCSRQSPGSLFMRHQPKSNSFKSGHSLNNFTPSAVKLKVFQELQLANFLL